MIHIEDGQQYDDDVAEGIAEVATLVGPSNGLGSKLFCATLVIEIDNSGREQWGYFDAGASSTTIYVENGSGTQKALEIDAESITFQDGSTGLCTISSAGGLDPSGYIVTDVGTSGPPSSSNGDIGSLYVEDTGGDPILWVKTGSSTWTDFAFT